MKLFKKIPLPIFFFFYVFIGNIHATHIVGGELYYDCLGSNTYKLTLKIYRDCNPGNLAFDDTLYISAWDKNSTPNFLDTSILYFPGSILVPFVSSDTCLTPPTNVCVEEAIYTSTITLPSSITGYTFAYQRCCRNSTIIHIVDPMMQGKTFFETVPASYLCNSSPRFNHYPPIALCVNKPFEFDHSATDLDGDSLVYYICGTYNGANMPPPNPIISSPPPFDPIVYLSPYVPSNPIDGSPNLSIDPISGWLTITPTQLGQFVIGICCDEYRGGILIGNHFRDFEFNVTSCSTIPGCGSLGQKGEQVLPILVYPNPITSEVVIKSSQQINIFIFDLLGKLVYQSTNENTLHSISTAEWTNGIYNYRAYSKDGMSTGKLIKN